MELIFQKRLLMRRMLALPLVVALACCGCGLLCPTPSAHRATDRGTVEIAFPVCRKLHVIGHSVQRGAEGKLVVRIRWFNRSQKPLEGRIRMMFFDDRGLDEVGSYRWDSHTFPPGQSTAEWRSYTKKAHSYLLEVRKGD